MQPNEQAQAGGEARPSVGVNDPHGHTAPLRWLVKQHLLKGRSVANNVVRLRYRRKRAKSPSQELHDTLAECSKMEEGQP